MLLAGVQNLTRTALVNRTLFPVDLMVTADLLTHVSYSVLGVAELVNAEHDVAKHLIQVRPRAPPRIAVGLLSETQNTADYVLLPANYGCDPANR